MVLHQYYTRTRIVQAGHLSKAIDLAFETHQMDALQLISLDLNESSDPLILQRCARFFSENGQYDRAVELLANARLLDEAIELCAEKNVQLNEPLLEKLTNFGGPPPPSGSMRMDAGGKRQFALEERVKLLEMAADVCMQQGQYQLATKKYTQAGNKQKAMKALLKSGDTEKIVCTAYLNYFSSVRKLLLHMVLNTS